MRNPRQLLTAGIAGALGTGLDLGVLVLLVGHHVSIPLATFIAALAGAVANFALNKYVAFRDRSSVTASQLGRFGIVAVVTALVMALAMEIVAVKLRVPTVLAKLICSALVFVGWTYPAQRRVFVPSLQESL